MRSVSFIGPSTIITRVIHLENDLLNPYELRTQIFRVNVVLNTDYSLILLVVKCLNNKCLKNDSDHVNSPNQKLRPASKIFFIVHFCTFGRFSLILVSPYGYIDVGDEISW